MIWYTDTDRKVIEKKPIIISEHKIQTSKFDELQQVKTIVMYSERNTYDYLNNQSEIPTIKILRPSIPNRYY